MAIKTEPTYSEFEVSRILRESEDEKVSASDKGEGHAEKRHELRAVGAGRGSTTLELLEMRVVGPELIDVSSAFDGCQAAAIAFALNKKAGQTALGWLCWAKARAVFATIDIHNGNFPIVTFSGKNTVPAPSGARFIVGPGGYKATFGGLLVPVRGTAQGIGMLLLKSPSQRLHIRTAFPIPDPLSGGSTAKITWADGRKYPEDRDETVPLPI